MPSRPTQILSLLEPGALASDALAQSCGASKRVLSSTIAELLRKGLIRNVSPYADTKKGAAYAITPKGRDYLSSSIDNAWTDEQLTLIRERWLIDSDVELAAAVSLVGPKRSPSALQAKRHGIGLKRPPGGLLKASEARAKAEEHRKGWPVPQGDKAFLRALYAALNPKGQGREAA